MRSSRASKTSNAREGRKNMAIKVDKLKEARKAALLARMRQGQSVSTGTRSYFKDGLEGVNFWSLKEGAHILVIILYVAGPDDPQVKEGDPTYVLEIYIHPDVGGIENQTMICPERTYKTPCPICEHRRALQKEGADEELVKSLQPKRYPRSIYNVVVYDSEKDEAKGVQIFDASHFLFEMYLLKLAQGTSRAGQKPTGFISFSDPEEGRSIRFTRQGTKENTRYIAHAFEARNYTIPKEILDSAHCLDPLIHVPTYEEIYNAYWGETPAEEALPRTSSGGGGSPARSTRSASAPVEDEAPPPEEEAPVEEEAPDSENQELAAALDDRGRAGLKAFIAEQNLDIKVYKEQSDGKYSDAWIREAILQVLGNPIADEDQPPPEEEEAPPPARAGQAGKPAAGGKKCPGGGTFGKDLNDLQHCEFCTVWDDCMAENERMLKQRQGSQERGKAAAASGAKPTGTKPAGGRFAKK